MMYRRFKAYAVPRAVQKPAVGWYTFVTILLLALMLCQPARAAGGEYDGKSDSRFSDVNSAIKGKQYQKAIDLLTVMADETPDDADVHNLLGFSNRKLGNFDVAFDHYQKALAIDPKHIRAHEYLGELYLQTDRLADAEKQLERVDELCSLFCKERRILKKAIKQYKRQNS
ncbi:MAG: tetratricopeptide repeat protein [Pseudomonadota bacterium]